MILGNLYLGKANNFVIVLLSGWVTIPGGFKRCLELSDMV